MLIRTKLILAFILSGVIPLLVVFGVTLESINVSVNAAFTEQIDVTAEMAERTVTLFLDGVSKRAQDWSTDGHVNASVARLAALPPESPEALALSRELGDYLRTRKLPLDPSVLIVEVLGTDGRVMASSEPSRVGHAERPDELEREYAWQRALAAGYGQTVESGLVSLEDDEAGHPKEPTMHASVSLSGSPAHPIQGVLTLHVSGMELARLLADLRSRPGRSSLEVYLVNRDGYFATPLRSAENAVLKEKIDTEPVRRCLGHDGRMNGYWTDRRGVEVLGASRCRPGRWWILLAEMDRSEVEAAVMSARLRNVWVILLTALMAGAAGLGLSVVMGRRVGKCTAVIKELAQGKFGARVPASDLKRDEIGQAAVGVNAMAERLDSYFGSLNQIYEAVFRQAPVGIMTVASDGKVASVNGRAAAVVGTKAGDDLIASAWYRECGLEGKLRGALNGTPFEHEFATADGRFFMLTGTPLKERKDGEVLLLFEDVTQRKRFHEGQRMFAARLEREVEERTRDLEAEKRELERTNAHLVGRELRMVELKKRIGELEGKPATEDLQPPLTPNP